METSDAGGCVWRMGHAFHSKFNPGKESYFNLEPHICWPLANVGTLRLYRTLPSKCIRHRRRGCKRIRFSQMRVKNWVSGSNDLHTTAFIAAASNFANQGA